MALSGMVMFPVPKVPKTWRGVFGSRNIYRSKVEKKDDDINDDYDDDDNSDSYDDDDKQVTSVKKSTSAKPDHRRKSKRQSVVNLRR